MAAYGADDFVYDFDSDFSDEEELIENLEREEEDDIEEPPYCTCGAPNDDQMVMCESQMPWKCVVPLNFECIGVTESTLPDGAWICQACLDLNVEGIYSIFVDIVLISTERNNGTFADWWNLVKYRILQQQKR